MKKGNKGFTLIELMIVVAIIAIIASIAIPNLLSARLSANETAAIATLRNLASAQAQCQASGVIDGDGDGTGEYGYFGELSGAIGVRGFVAGAIALTATKISPPVLSGAFGNIVASNVSRSGYLFRLYLPGNTTPGEGVAEAPAGGATGIIGTISSDLSETTWCAYAWPVNRGNSGNRAFFVNQQGDVLQTQNNIKKYSGTAAGLFPAADAAFTGVATLINQALAITTPTKVGLDTEVWSNVQ